MQMDNSIQFVGPTIPDLTSLFKILLHFSLELYSILRKKINEVKMTQGHSVNFELKLNHSFAKPECVKFNFNF